nr:MAG TPA: hypothetical protein [Caudoviricetes sp.]
MDAHAPMRAFLLVYNSVVNVQRSYKQAQYVLPRTTEAVKKLCQSLFQVV